MDAIELDRAGRTIRFTDERVTLDLGGIAKGHALDEAAAVLREADVDCALLHGGTSTAVAIGAPPEHDGWRIALRSDGLRRTIVLRDEALSVSAPHGRTVERDGMTIGHVIDPNSGRPVSHAALAAVTGPSARRADAWSTALLVTAFRPASMPDAYASLIVVPDHPGSRCLIGGSRARVFQCSSRHSKVARETSCVSSIDAPS
jgi:thiamine biosynthesis lipoprotein